MREQIVTTPGRLLPGMISLLLNMMKGRFRNFPKDYLVVDTETTGFDATKELITQVGCVLVLDGEVASQVCDTLDWSRHPQIDQFWLQNRLVEVKQAMEFKDGVPTGKTYHATYEKLQQGREPITALSEFHQLMTQSLDDGLFVLAHNGLFDLNFLREHFDRFLGKPGFDWGDHSMFDTGMCVKAAQSSMAPWPEDTPRAFAKRVGSARLKGVYWALDNFCVPHFQLVEKYGRDKSQAHDAGADCVTTHHLFQELLKLAEAVP